MQCTLLVSNCDSNAGIQSRRSSNFYEAIDENLGTLPFCHSFVEDFQLMSEFRWTTNAASHAILNVSQTVEHVLEVCYLSWS